MAIFPTNDEQMSNKVRVEHQGGDPLYLDTLQMKIDEFGWVVTQWPSDPLEVVEVVVESSMFASNVSGSRLVQHLFQYHSIHPRP